MSRSLGARARHALDWRFATVRNRLDELIGRLDGLDARLARLDALGALEAIAVRLDALDARLGGLDARFAALADRVDSELAPTLRALVAEEAENRRRLYDVRDTAGYAAAYADPEPLVSVVITTHDRADLLVERAIASAVAQTYERIEVVVAGDEPTDAVRAALRGLRDPRVQCVETTQRVEHADAGSRWLVGATMARNLGTRHARGAWIADLDDDDALRPDALERLLAFARAERAEVAYGQLDVHSPAGQPRRYGSFPPRLGDFMWQGGIWHAGLRYFERELFASAYGLPGDFFRAERMLRAGVRFAHLPVVTGDYYPARLWLAEEDVADAVHVGDRHGAVERQRQQ